MTCERKTRADVTRFRQYSQTSEKSGISLLSQETQMTDISDNSGDNTDTGRNINDPSDRRISLLSMESGGSVVRFDLEPNSDGGGDEFTNQFDDRSSTLFNSNASQSAFDSTDSYLKPVGSSRKEDSYIHALASNSSKINTPSNEQRSTICTRPQRALDNSDNGRVTPNYDYAIGANVCSPRKRRYDPRIAAKRFRHRRSSDLSSDHTYTSILPESECAAHSMQLRCLQHSIAKSNEDITRKDNNTTCPKCRTLQQPSESYPRTIGTLRQITQPTLRTSQTWPKEIMEYPLEALINNQENIALNSSRDELDNRLNGYTTQIRNPDSGYAQLHTSSSGTPNSVNANMNMAEHACCPCVKYIKQNKSFRKLVVSLVCFNVILILCTVILILFIFVSSQINQNCCSDYLQSTPHSAQQNKIETCVNREFIEKRYHLRRADLQDMMGLDTLTSDKFCFGSLTQILKLLDTILESELRDVRSSIEYNRHHSGNQSAMLRPVIQVRGDGGTPVQIQGTSRTMSYKLKWNQRHNMIQNGGVHLSHDGHKITVVKAGHYFVYSRVHFRFLKSTGQDEKPISISHWLVKEGSQLNGGSVDIDSVYQNCWLAGRTVEHTSVLETVVHLHAGASLYIKLKGEDSRDHLDRNGRKHTFGVFYI